MFLPDKVCTWTDHGITVFSSNKNKGGRTISLDNTLLTVIIFSTGNLTKEDISRKIKQFVTFLVFFALDYYSARWLVHTSWSGVEKRIKKTKDLSRVISSNIEKRLKRPKLVYRNYESTHIAFRETDLYNFKDLANKYFKLDDGSRLKELIHLLAFNWTIPGLLSNFYDNVNLDISLTYTLVDSIIKDSGIDETETKKCIECGHETKGKKGDKKRIKDFVETLDLDETNKTLYKKIFLNIYQIRNDFFHEGRIMTILGNMKKAMSTGDKTEGKGTTIHQEAEHGQSRLLGVSNIKLLVTAILVSKLEAT